MPLCAGGPGLARPVVDHDGRRPAAVPQQRHPDAHARDDALDGRRGRACDRALADRRRGRRSHEQGDRAHQGREEPRQGPRPARPLPPERPAHVPDPQLGSLRQPRQGGREARDAGVLHDHGPRAELRAPHRAAQPAQERRHVPALSVALSQLRGGRRQALLRHVPRRERGPPGAAPRVDLVAVERAQPARLAVAAVGEGQRRERARGADPLPRAAPGRRPGPRALRPRQRRDLPR